MTSSQACRYLKEAQSLTLIIHERPDGDAIGSALALWHAFHISKSVEIVCSTDVARIFSQVVGDFQVKNTISTTTELIVLIDCANARRSGFEKELATASQNGKRIIAFDHHSHCSFQKIAAVTVHDPLSSSTAEIVFDCLADLRISITPEIAQCLLLGVYTDTGGFQHTNTTSKTLRAVSRLIRLGANLEQLRSVFGEHRTLAKMKLWGTVFSNVRLNPLGIVSIRINKETLRLCGADLSDVAGIANNLALLKEARAAVVLVETERGWKASVRTRHPHIDLRRLTYYFGGKGTQKATGFLATKELLSGKIK